MFSERHFSGLKGASQATNRCFRLSDGSFYADCRDLFENLQREVLNGIERLYIFAGSVGRESRQPERDLGSVRAS